MLTTRFAPSPNGSLHLGHAFSAIIAHDLAKENDGRFLLRIEDIDGGRSRPELADEFRADLEWLGLAWEEVPAQSTRLEAYENTAEKLRAMDVLYPCECTRADIQAAGAVMGPMGAIYPGICKGAEIGAGAPLQWRFNIDLALEITGELTWNDRLAGVQICDPAQLGDVVLVRKDEPASYHLAATLDDASDGVTLVTRGRDLFPATHIHRLIQKLLDLPEPDYHHHPLLLDDSGKKLAKTRNSPALSDRRKSGEDGVLLAKQLRLQSFPSGISLQKP